MSYKLDVVDRDSLDEASQALHPKPWLVVAPNGAIEYFDTEDEACDAQVAGGLEAA
jgi:hypothetical protein